MTIVQLCTPTVHFTICIFAGTFEVTINLNWQRVQNFIIFVYFMYSQRLGVI